MKKYILIMIAILCFGFYGCMKKQSYSIQYYVDQELILEKSYQEGEIFDFPSMKKDGYTFDGWYLDSNLKTPYLGNMVVKENLSLYGTYKEGNPTGLSSAEDRIPTTDLTYLDFFDINNKISIEISISDLELQKLNRDYVMYGSRGSKSAIYRMADSVSITIEKNEVSTTFVYTQVGIRMKGNTSRHEFINQDDEIYSLIHYKLSFSETFDSKSKDIVGEDYYDTPLTWNPEEKLEREDRTFLGLEKLDLRYNSSEDHTYIKEYYAHELYRENGILASHINKTSLTLNQKHIEGETQNQFGIYSVEENVDKDFIKRELKNYKGPFDLSYDKSLGVGDLYKCSWGSGQGASMTRTTSNGKKLYGIENEDNNEFYTYDLKTNKKTSTHESFLNFISILNSAKSYNEIEGIVDLNYFAMYEAVSYLLGGPDDARNNYNNYYLYFNPVNQKAYMIPTDQDRVLGITYQWDPSGNAMSTKSVYSTYRSTGDSQENKLYLLTVSTSNKNDVRDLYFQNIQMIIGNTEMFSKERFNSIYEIVKSNYENDLSSWSVNFNLNETYNGSNENMSFSQYYDAKIKKIQETN